MALSIRAKASCRFDLVALGEVMLRLDPGDERITTTRRFRVWEGGGEYNVARGLKRCFGLDTAIVTALVDNPVGRLVQDLIYQGGVDQSYLRWVADDGVGRSARNGLNFTERGFGVRAPVGCSDRGHTAVSQLAPGAIDWDRLFGVDGARWFHTGGIFAALSESTAAVAEEAMAAARREYPQLAMIATTLRVARSASSNDWGAMAYCDGNLIAARTRPDLAIYDRIGGGDSFASGLIYGLLAGRGAAWAIECGAAHGALAMTTPGDTTMATLAEVEKVMAGTAARVER